MRFSFQIAYLEVIKTFKAFKFLWGRVHIPSCYQEYTSMPLKLSHGKRTMGHTFFMGHWVTGHEQECIRVVGNVYGYIRPNLVYGWCHLMEKELQIELECKLTL